MPAQNVERAIQVCDLYQAGYTLQEIGEFYGLSRERIRQILKSSGLVGRDGGQAQVARRRRYTKAIVQLDYRNTRSMAVYGCDWETLLLLNEGKGPSVKGCCARGYMEQQRNARLRGVEWDLTFPQWMTVWLESGKLSERGRAHGKYVMGRLNDYGPYAPWNVYITTFANNVAEYQAELKVRGVFCPDGYKRLPEHLKSHSATPP